MERTISTQYCDLCPHCRSILPYETTRVDDSISGEQTPNYSHTNYKKTTNFAERVCPECGHIVPPRTAQLNSVRIDFGSIESGRDDFGFTHPNLHRRIKYCICDVDWECQLHKHIGPCDCTPMVECDCGKLRLQLIRGRCSRPRQPKELSDEELLRKYLGLLISKESGNLLTLSNMDDRLLVGDSVSPIIPGVETDFMNGVCGSNIDRPGTLSAECINLEEYRRGRYSDRQRPTESYRVGVYSHNSMRTTEVHLHHEEQTHIELS